MRRDSVAVGRRERYLGRVCGHLTALVGDEVPILGVDGTEPRAELAADGADDVKSL